MIHLLPSFARRRLRPLWLAAAVTMAWSNRRDLERWLSFGKRVIGQRPQHLPDLLTEAKVRLVVTRDPQLRHDPALADLRVDGGVVTLMTTTAGWPDPRDQLWRIRRTSGVTDVVSELTSATIAG